MNKITKFIILNLFLLLNLQAAEQKDDAVSSGENKKKIELPEEYIIPRQEGISNDEVLDINDFDGFSAASFKELIEDKTELEEGKEVMPYTLARVVSVDDQGVIYVKYYDAELMNQYLFGQEKPNFKSDLELRQHLIRKKDLISRHGIQDVQYFTIMHIDYGQFKYHGNVFDYAVAVSQEEGVPSGTQEQIPAPQVPVVQPQQDQDEVMQEEIQDAPHLPIVHPAQERRQIDVPRLPYRIRRLEIPRNHRYRLDLIKNNLSVFDNIKSIKINSLLEDKHHFDLKFLDKLLSQKNNITLINQYINLYKNNSDSYLLDYYKKPDFFKKSLENYKKPIENDYIQYLLDNQNQLRDWNNLEANDESEQASLLIYVLSTIKQSKPELRQAIDQLICRLSNINGLEYAEKKQVISFTKQFIRQLS